ncbi:MAG: 2-oxoacid:acceptor oxidoreductase subunit alpha [Legionellaceae bacterium]|nr:2-oxoacid:acceptor oxidoreductase subunit alpha [Legionellaceae bacterium]
MSIKESIVIRLTGDSGDGVQIVGQQLTLTAALSGREVRTLPDFPAEIRAPTGTLAGVSGFQLAMSDHAIFTAGESLDVLVALNPAALRHSLSYLQQGGLLIFNDDAISAKDWEKAGLTVDYLDQVASLYQLIRVPLITNTLKALEHLSLSHAESKKSKNFYVLGMVLWLFDLTCDAVKEWIDKKFPQNIAEANNSALKAGYDYAMTLELSRQDFMMDHLVRAPGKYRQVTGIEALSLGIASMAVMTKTPLLVSGYPITPASSILQECAKWSSYGVQLFQAEDEISAVCACLGAAFAGRLALACTSGPGLDLKSEGLGLGVVSELPCVIVDVQRAGASTGLPTKTSQSDLRQALYGRHGEAPLPVIAARSPADCFDAVIEAFSIAVRGMTPVILLLDAYLATAAEPWKIPHPESLSISALEWYRFPKPYTRDMRLTRSWNPPGKEGFIHQIGGLEKQGEDGRVSYDPDNHATMVATRAEKIANLALDYPPLQIEGDADASVLLIAWGGTYGMVRSALVQCKEMQLPLAYVHLKHLNPLPQDLECCIQRYAKVLVIELNSGQLCEVIRARYLVDARPITQCNGLPFSANALVNAIQKELAYEHV